jgi:hypothetical protein
MRAVLLRRGFGIFILCQRAFRGGERHGGSAARRLQKIAAIPAGLSFVPNHVLSFASMGSNTDL